MRCGAVMNDAARPSGRRKKCLQGEVDGLGSTSVPSQLLGGLMQEMASLRPWGVGRGWIDRLGVNAAKGIPLRSLKKLIK